MDELLRVEAQPRSASELTRTQIDALERILNVLAAAVDDLPSPEAGHRDDLASTSLDEQRKSRIFFLSGEAGTGKTTVYLWLRKYASRSTKKKDFDKEHEALSEAGGKQGSIATQLKNLHHGLVWLEPLALEEVANAATNYLAAILARIDQVLTDKLGTGTGGAASSSDRLGFDRPGMTEALTEFERLRTDIGLAWDGNLPQRGAHLDPDVFAEEVMRAEGARIRINRRFHEVLERLTERIYQRDENPLFVLPVDDLSLNPGPSLEILRLLRMISVPRLFILALGDESTFEELGFQRVLGDQIFLAGEEAFKVDRQKRVLMARARQLSFNAMRKLIPPGQRAHLQALYWDEALKLSAKGESSDGGQRKPLWQSLHKVPLKDLVVSHWEDADWEGGPDPVPWTLLEFLAYPGDSRIELAKLSRLADKSSAPTPERLEPGEVFKEPAGIEDAYTALQILEVPLRHAIDLSLSLAELPSRIPDRGDQEAGEGEKGKHQGTGKQEGKSRWQKERCWQIDFFRWLGHEALRHLNEQNYMSDEERERCEEAIRGPWYTSVSLDTTELGCQPDYDSEFTTAAWPCDAKAEQRPTLFQARPVVEVRPHRRWRLGPKDAITDRGVYQSQQRPVGTWSFMPPRPLAWFVLLHDLLVLTRNHGLQGNPLLPTWDGHCWAGTRWCSPARANRSEETNRSRWLEDSTFIPWPVPEWTSFWHFDGFLAGWNAVLATASAPKELLEVEESAKGWLEDWKRQQIEDHLVYWWIRLAVDVFRPSCVPPERRVAQGLLPAFGEEPDWNKLWEDLRELEGSTPASNKYHANEYHAIRRWFVHLGVLAAPEYGLSPPVIKQILDEKNGGIASTVSGEDAARYIRKVRAKNTVRYFPDMDTAEKLEAAAKASASPWSTGDSRFRPKKDSSRNWFPTKEDLSEAIQKARDTRRAREVAQKMDARGSRRFLNE